MLFFKTSIGFVIALSKGFYDLDLNLPGTTKSSEYFIAFFKLLTFAMLTPPFHYINSISYLP